VEFAVETGQWGVADELMADLRGRADLPPVAQDLIAVNGYYVLVAMTLNVDRTPVPGGGQLPLKPLAKSLPDID